MYYSIRNKNNSHVKYSMMSYKLSTEELSTNGYEEDILYDSNR